MKDLRLFSLMGGALILAWLLAPRTTVSSPPEGARKDLPVRRREDRLEEVGPFHVDESFVPQRYVH